MATPSTSNRLVILWQRCGRLPGGQWLFSRILGHRVPYSGTIKARVEELAPGYCKARIADRRRVRNHLESIHAIALANLGELATGLAMMAALPATARGIPTEITVEFLKKARGDIVAEAHCTVPDTSEQHEHGVEARLMDDTGDLVARFKARWVVGPRN